MIYLNENKSSEVNIGILPITPECLPRRDFMYAIINKGNGKFYTSMVFACYRDRQTEDETNYWDQYVIVLNENKTALVKRYFFDYSRRPYLNKMVIITDGNLKN